MRDWIAVKSRAEKLVEANYDPECTECVKSLENAIAEIAQLQQDKAELVRALRNVVNNLPEDEIHIAAEVWGHTNTNIVLSVHRSAKEIIAKHGGELK